MGETVSLEVDGSIALIAIDRPKALNALNTQVLTELGEVVETLEKTSSVRAAILTGKGEKAFVAGADIAEMASLSPQKARAFSAYGHRVFERFIELSIPTLAAVNGFALGGGCELMLSCDIILASEKAKLGFPEVTLGVIPGFGGTQRLVERVGLGAAKQLIFTGAMIDAQAALAAGLVDRVVPADELLPACKALAQQVSKNAPLAVQQAKKLIRAASGQNRLGHALEQQAFGLLFGTEDQQEGMKAFLDKRPAQFKGS